MTVIKSSGNEIAFAFPCQGEELIGFIHQGDPACEIGLLTLVAGGPQYRAGVGRQLINLGRRLASEGIPVMRFDHRGTGDGEGDGMRRFAAMHDDIAAAIAQFKKHTPNLRGIILWGGCDSATTALINAYKFPEVICVIAGNPFVSSSVTANKVARKHYLSRLTQASFWKKVVSMEYNIGDYVGAFAKKLRTKFSTKPANVSGNTTTHSSANFLVDLQTGMREFNGKVLFLMGDRFLLSDEFDMLMDSSPQWRAIYKKSGFERIDIKGGDQVFSSADAQARMFDEVTVWINGAFNRSSEGQARV